MNSLTRLIASGSIAALLIWPSPAAVFADDSDIFGANVQPNVMIFIDDSGSMYGLIGDRSGIRYAAAQSLVAMQRRSGGDFGMVRRELGAEIQALFLIGLARG